MTVLTDKPEVSCTDAAVVEELAEIYTTTPKGWRKAKQSNLY